MAFTEFTPLHTILGIDQIRLEESDNELIAGFQTKHFHSLVEFSKLHTDKLQVVVGSVANPMDPEDETFPMLTFRRGDYIDLSPEQQNQVLSNMEPEDAAKLTEMDKAKLQVTQIGVNDGYIPPFVSEITKDDGYTPEQLLKVICFVKHGVVLMAENHMVTALMRYDAGVPV